jgi:hypothetical protein
LFFLDALIKMTLYKLNTDMRHLPSLGGRQPSLGGHYKLMYYVQEVRNQNVCSDTNKFKTNL